MNNKFIAALVCLGFTGAVSAADVDFAKGVDISKTIEQASKLDYPFPGQPGNHHNDPHNWDGSNFSSYYGNHADHVRFSRDCHTFNFGPFSGGMMSEMARLESVEYIRVCHFVPDPPPLPPQPNPNGPKPPKPGQPNQPGHGPKSADETVTKGMECREVPHDVFRRTAQLYMQPRQLLPWENDSFEVCMEGPRVDIRARSTAYSYDIREDGHFDVRYELTPQYKLTTAPDRNGMSLAGWAFKDGKFVLSVNDIWAQYYAGEKVAIKVELVKDGFLFFNSSQGEKEFTLDAAGSYQLVFAENELTKTKDFVDTRGDTRGPKKFFAKWSFRRIGSVSTQQRIDKGSTEKITQ